MRSLLLGNTTRFSTASIAAAKALLVAASLLCCLPLHAASNSASARLRIQVTVIRTVQPTPTPASNSGPSGSISYNLQPQRTQSAVSQTEIQLMPVQKLQKVSSSVTVLNDGPAVLQTMTIVGE